MRFVKLIGVNYVVINLLHTYQQVCRKIISVN